MKKYYVTAALAAAFLALFVTMAAADTLKTDLGKSDVVTIDVSDMGSATKTAAELNNTNKQVNTNTSAIAANTKAAAAAQTTANNAISNADAARTNALRAITDAAKAQTTANNAMQKSEGAMNTALDAQNVAKNAQATADTANERAATAQETADTAQKSADGAQTTADIAEAKADTNSKAITATQESIGDDEFRKVSVQERLEKLNQKFGNIVARPVIDNSIDLAVKAANDYTDSRINTLNGRIDRLSSKVKKLRARADSGIAGATAIGSLTFDSLKPNAVSGGLGIAKNKVAGAFGYQRNFNDQWRARAAISVSDNYVQGGTSVGFSW